MGRTNKQTILLTVLTTLFFGFSFSLNFMFKLEQQFVYMASSFLQGKLYLVEKPFYWWDTVYFSGHYYWPLSPFPSVLLLPFVFVFQKMGIFFYQGYLQFGLTVAIAFMAYKLARHFKYSKEDSWFLSFAFCFSSVYIVATYSSWSWYFASAIAVFLLFLSLYLFYIGKKNYLFIGLLLGLVCATRFTAGLCATFFLIEIIFENVSWKQRIKNMFKLSIPILLCGLLLLYYNYVRFQNPFDNGYMRANNVVATEAQRFELLNYGLFQVRNIPTNFYYYFIKTLDPVLVEFNSANGNTYILKPPYFKVGYPGTSFFVVSPIFIYLFKLKLKKRHLSLILVNIVVLSVLMTYYWPGWRQVGPRYMLDVLPFTFVLLLYSFPRRRLSNFSKLIIMISAMFNLYLFTTVFFKVG